MSLPRYKKSMCYSGLGVCLVCVGPYHPLPHHLDQVLHRLSSILGMCLCMVYPYRPLPHHLDQVLLRLKSVLTRRRHACQRRTSGKLEQRTPCNCKPVFAKRNVMQTKSAVRTHLWKAPQMHGACNKKFKTYSGGR